MEIYHFRVSISKNGEIVTRQTGSVESARITNNGDYNKLCDHILEFQVKEHSCSKEDIFIENISRL